jgi:RluA family pseudouridine synthase
MERFKDFTIRLNEYDKEKIRFIYQDNELIIVDKPPRLRVIPDRFNTNLPNLSQLLSNHIAKMAGAKAAKIWPVHRIDADTSGLVMCALSEKTHQMLNEAFELKKIKKTYLAIVRGKIEESDGVINYPIEYYKKGKVRIRTDGKPSATKFKVKQRYHKYSLLEISPITGRTHQIRIHLQAYGYPLAIDPIYAGVDRVTISDIKARIRPQKKSEAALISRQTLHAWRLEFIHPMTQKNVSVTADPPKDFSAFTKALSKWDRL